MDQPPPACRRIVPSGRTPKKKPTNFWGIQEATTVPPENGSKDSKQGFFVIFQGFFGVSHEFSNERNVSIVL